MRNLFILLISLLYINTSYAVRDCYIYFQHDKGMSFPSTKGNQKIKIKSKKIWPMSKCFKVAKKRFSKIRKKSKFKKLAKKVARSAALCDVKTPINKNLRITLNLRAGGTTLLTKQFKSKKLASVKTNYRCKWALNKNGKKSKDKKLCQQIVRYLNKHRLADGEKVAQQAFKKKFPQLKTRFKKCKLAPGKISKVKY